MIKDTQVLTGWLLVMVMCHNQSFNSLNRSMHSSYLFWGSPVYVYVIDWIFFDRVCSPLRRMTCAITVESCSITGVSVPCSEGGDGPLRMTMDGESQQGRFHWFFATFALLRSAWHVWAVFVMIGSWSHLDLLIWFTHFLAALFSLVLFRNGGFMNSIWD